MTGGTTRRDVVVGLGNPLRRDDGVGAATAAVIARHVPPGVEVVTVDGDDPAALLDAWCDARTVVVVDAVRHPDAPPGSVRLLDPERLGHDVPTASSHGVDLGVAYRLSAVLGCRPERLVVLGVQVADTGLGHGLSPAVVAALPHLVDRALAELGHGDGVAAASPPPPSPSPSASAPATGSDMAQGSRT